MVVDERESLALVLSAAARSFVVAGMPTLPVISGIGVMTIAAHARGGPPATGVKRRSLVGDDAEQVLAPSTTGRPGDAVAAAELVEVPPRSRRGPIVTGLEIIPVWVRLTRSTWQAWSSIDRLQVQDAQATDAGHRNGHPGPVTVSMAAETIGTLREIRGSVGRSSTSLGMTSVSPGCSRTSS